MIRCCYNRPGSSSPDHSGSELDVLSDDDGVAHLQMDPSTSMHHFGGGAGCKARRRRTAFSTEQLMELEKEFLAKKYLSLTERSQIATHLHLSEVQVLKRFFFLKER